MCCMGRFRPSKGHCANCTSGDFIASILISGISQSIFPNLPSLEAVTTVAEGLSLPYRLLHAMFRLPLPYTFLVGKLADVSDASKERYCNRIFAIDPADVSPGNSTRFLMKSNSLSHASVRLRDCVRCRSQVTIISPAFVVPR